MMSNILLNYKDVEKDIEEFENNFFDDDSLEEIEIPVSEDEVYILFNKKFVFANGKFAVILGSDCNIVDDGMPEPDCSIALVYENKEKIDYKNYLYAELQGSADSCVYNFISNYNWRINKLFADDKAISENLGTTTIKTA